MTDRCEMTQALARSRERLQQQTDLLKLGSRSAADYVASICRATARAGTRRLVTPSGNSR